MALPMPNGNIELKVDARRLSTLCVEAIAIRGWKRMVGWSWRTLDKRRTEPNCASRVCDLGACA
eukprot:1424597-Pleurochrysis_carterae.AAC.1